MHRGPDDEGIFVKAGVGLGMRRLSIIDLAGGHQPVFNEDKTIWIVFNGEIYNFPELRIRTADPRSSLLYPHAIPKSSFISMKSMGRSAFTSCGACSLSRSTTSARRLLLARDRFGKKPLHYALQNGDRCCSHRR